MSSDTEAPGSGVGDKAAAKPDSASRAKAAPTPDAPPAARKPASEPKHEAKPKADGVAKPAEPAKSGSQSKTPPAKPAGTAKPRRQARGKPTHTSERKVPEATARSAAAASPPPTPPPTIRPKTKPSPTAGYGNIKRVGHADGEPRPAQSGAGLTPGSHGPRRSYRTMTQTGLGPVPPETATATAHRPPVETITSPPGEVRRVTTKVVAAAATEAKTPIPQVPLTMTGPGGISATVTPEPDARPPKKPVTKRRRVKLNVGYIAPLSVMKLSFLMAIALGIAFVVAVFILWQALNDRHVFVTIDEMITELIGASRPESLEIMPYVELGRVMSGATILAVINVVLITVISTLLAVIYNIVAALVGGVYVTLRED